MNGNGLMSAVLRVRPDIKGLRRELEREVPDAVRDAAKKADGAAKRDFTKVGKTAGEAVGDGIEKGAADGLRRGADGRLRDAKGRYAKLGKDIGDEVGSGIERGVTQRWDGMANKLNGLGKKLMTGGAVATAGLTLPMAMLGKAAAETAINYEDAIAANEQLFGKEGLALIEQWSKTRADAFNFAQADVQTTAQGFAGYMQAFGSEQRAAEETTKVLERLADARSFYGGRMQDKALALQSALRGEYDPMETAFPGASIKQSDVAARAAQMGLLTVNTAQLAKAQERVTALEKAGKKNTADYSLAKQKLDEVSQGATDSMTKEARVQATLALFYEQTAKAAGDVARTQDSTANKIEDARQQWEDLKLTLGQQLLPIIGELAPKFAVMIKRLDEKGVFDRLVPAIEKLADVLSTVLDAFTKLPGGVQSAVLGLAMFGGPIATVTGAVSSLVSGLMNAISWFGRFTTAAQTAGAASAASGLGSGAAGAAGGMGLRGLLGATPAAAGAGTTGLAVAGAAVTGYAIGSGINSHAGRLVGSDRRVSDSLADTIYGSGWGRSFGNWMAGFDSGGVMGGPRGQHAPALVAGGETILPTHRMPLPDAMAAVGISSGGGRVEALLEQALARPATVTVVAPPGMDTRELATEIDALARGAGARRLRPAANRRFA